MRHLGLIVPALLAADLAFGIALGKTIKWLGGRSRINADERTCPACGNAGCTLKTVVTRTEANALLEVVVERTCKTCGAVAAEPPVLDKAVWLA